MLLFEKSIQIDPRKKPFAIFVGQKMVVELLVHGHSDFNGSVSAASFDFDLLVCNFARDSILASS